MSRDAVAAIVTNGRMAVSDQALLPLYLKKTGDIESWLKGRAIDSHRTNSRLLKKALRISAADDIATVLKVNAATITDTYWFCPKDSDLKYENVRFNENLFDELALRGAPDSFNRPYSPTPELTNIGSFEKCWRLVDGRWWMVKQGNDLERFSELFICRLGQALGFTMADYMHEDSTVKSPDFTDGATVNYEAAEGLVGDDEDYLFNFRVFYDLSTALAEQYMQIVYLDTLCFNMDRHTKNYGVLRDVETGAILRMAPNYDNNIALFARGIPQDLNRANDRLISFFRELTEQDRCALSIARLLPVPTVEMIDDCIKRTGISIDSEAVRAFIINGSNQIQSGL
ncbi:MAG: hypothetical protein FWH33_03080 [Oscillospiraceae bacterium]|nr:hypothetical protein [Oscillospiraceae bacterium]